MHTNREQIKKIVEVGNQLNGCGKKDFTTHYYNETVRKQFFLI